MNYYFVNELEQKIDFSLKGAMPIIKADGINGHDIEVSEVQGLNQIGTSVTSTTVKSKTISLMGYIKDNVTRNRRDLINVMRPQMKGTLYTEIEGITYGLDVVIKQTPIIGAGTSYMPFEVDLLAPYPYWKKGKSKSATATTFVPLFQFPVNYSNEFKFSNLVVKEFIEAQNLGNEKSSFTAIIRAKGNIQNPKLLNVMTGEYIKLKYNMSTNEEITITTGYNNKKIVSNTKGNLFKYLDLANSTFFLLDPGEVKIRLDADLNRELTDVTIIFDEVVSSI